MHKCAFYSNSFERRKAMNTQLMTQNILNERMGVVPQVDVTKDLLPKTNYNVNSWFVFGKFDADGHIFNYLFHIMALKMPMPFAGFKYQTAISISDESTHYYYTKDYVDKESDIEISNDKFYIKIPKGEISGDWDCMKIKVHDKDFSLDTVVTAIHYPVITRGSSVFELLGMTIHQYSVPFMTTKGTLTLNGTTYDITDKGYTWFDRQWQVQDMKAPIKWSWMAIYLDNGDVISVLDSDVPGREEGLLSVLKTDGSQHNSTNVPPFKYGESEYWVSSVTKQKYPTHWKLKLPSINAELEITPIIKEQEIPSVMKPLSKYEGASRVTGTYQGMPVTGNAVVELIGTWPDK